MSLTEVKYEQHIRMLQEMIQNERKWIEEKSKYVLTLLESDITYAYAHTTLADIYHRSVKLNVMKMSLDALQR